MAEKIFTHQFQTELGRFYLAEDINGLAAICFGAGGKSVRDGIIKSDYQEHRIVAGGRENKKAERQIKSYLAGHLKKFDLRLSLSGTPFQRSVLNQVMKITYGRVKTYGQIARVLGKPGAARAVGSANARNRLPLVIPCHRVVAAGGLGGYAGGLKAKRKLLDLEGVEP